MTEIQNQRRILAELSLIFGVPIFTQADENSRLAGLQRKLQKVVLPDLTTIETLLNGPEVHLINNRLEEWIKRVGWWHQPTHITDLISFCMDVIDHSPNTYNPRISDTLNSIAEHLDNGKEFYAPTPVRRDNLMKTWKAVYV